MSRNPSNPVSTVIHNGEATMDSFLIASVAHALQLLQKTYLNPKISAYQREELTSKAIGFLKNRIEKSNDTTLITEWRGLEEQMDRPVSANLDRVGDTIYPLKEVVALVYLATMNSAAYAKEKNQESQDRRLETLFTAIKTMHQEKKRCSLGVRHDLVGTLNLTYPGIRILPPKELLLNRIAFDYIEEHLEKFTTERQRALLLIWVKQTEMPDELIAVLKSSENTGKMVTRIQTTLSELGIKKAEIDSFIEQFEDYIHDEDVLPYISAVARAKKSARDLWSFIHPALRPDTLLNHAHRIITQWVEDKWQPDGNNQLVADFTAVNQALNDLRLHERELRNWNEGRLTASRINKVKEICDTFAKTVQPIRGKQELNDGQGSKDDDSSPKGDREIFQKFQNAVLAYKSDERVDLIENIFAQFFASQPAQKNQLIQTTRDPVFIEKTVVSDKLIREWHSKSEAGTLELSPYQINRILLSAIIINPKKWSESFAALTNEAYDFIQRSFGQAEGAGTSGALRKDSYPDSLMAQIKYLLDYRSREDAVNDTDEQRASARDFPFYTTMLLNGERFNLIQDGDDLAAALRVTSFPEKAQLLEAVQNQLPDLITSAGQFASVLWHIYPQQRITVFNRLGNKLPSLITSTKQFSSACFFLRSEQRTVLFDAIRERLPALITNGDELVYALEPLKQEQRSAIFIAVQNRLSRLIKNRDQRQKVALYLNERQRTKLHRSLQEELPMLITNIGQLRLALDLFDYKHEKKALLDAIHNRAALTVTDIDKLSKLIGRLQFHGLHQHPLIVNIVRTQLPALITNTEQFTRALQWLHPDERTTVFNAIQARLPSLITSIEQLKRVFTYLNPEQHAAMLIAMQNQLPGLITSADDLFWILMGRKLEQRTALLSAVQNQLPKLITKAEVINMLLSLFSLRLNPDSSRPHMVAYDIILDAIADQLPSLIKSAKQLADLLSYLSQEKQAMVLKALQSQLPNLIANTGDLSTALRYLGVKERAWLLTATQKQLPALITNAGELSCVLNPLSPDQRTALFEQFQEQLPAWVTNPTELNSVLCYLNPEQRTALFEQFKGQLPAWITGSRPLCLVLRHLTSEQSMVVLDAIGARLPTLITNIGVLSSILSQLDPGPLATILDSFQGQLPAWNTNAMTLGWVLSPLRPEQRTVMLQKAQAQLPQLITTAGQLANMLKPYHEDQCKPVLDAVKDQLPTLITNTTQLLTVLYQLTQEKRAVLLKALGREQLKRILATGKGRLTSYRRDLLLAYQDMRNSDDRHVFNPCRLFQCFQINKNRKLETVGALLDEAQETPINQHVARNGLLGLICKATTHVQRATPRA
jgi:hypothetical protein